MLERRYTKADLATAIEDNEAGIKVVPVFEGDMRAIKKAAGEGNFESD